MKMDSGEFLIITQAHQACLKLKSSSVPTSGIEASTSLKLQLTCARQDGLPLHAPDDFHARIMAASASTAITLLFSV
jgi:hypothetical protein